MPTAWRKWRVEQGYITSKCVCSICLTQSIAGHNNVLGTDHLTWRGGVMVFCFVQNFFFRTTQELEFFFCRAKREFFFQNLTLGYMAKTLNHIFFFLHQNQIIFFSNIGNQNVFFRKKTITPPFKLNGRSLSHKENWIKRKCKKQ